MNPPHTCRTHSLRPSAHVRELHLRSECASRLRLLSSKKIFSAFRRMWFSEDALLLAFTKTSSETPCLVVQGERRLCHNASFGGCARARFKAKKCAVFGSKRKRRKGNFFKLFSDEKSKKKTSCGSVFAHLISFSSSSWRSFLHSTRKNSLSGSVPPVHFACFAERGTLKGHEREE